MRAHDPVSNRVISRIGTLAIPGLNHPSDEDLSPGTREKRDQGHPISDRIKRASLTMESCFELAARKHVAFHGVVQLCARCAGG